MTDQEFLQGIADMIQEGRRVLQEVREELSAIEQRIDETEREPTKLLAQPHPTQKEADLKDIQAILDEYHPENEEWGTITHDPPITRNMPISQILTGLWNDSLPHFQKLQELGRQGQERIDVMIHWEDLDPRGIEMWQVTLPAIDELPALNEQLYWI